VCIDIESCLARAPSASQAFSPELHPEGNYFGHAGAFPEVKRAGSQAAKGEFKTYQLERLCDVRIHEMEIR